MSNQPAHYRMVSVADHLNKLADTTNDAQLARCEWMPPSSSTAAWIAARSLKYVPLRRREIIIKRCADKALRGSSRALLGLFLPPHLFPPGAIQSLLVRALALNAGPNGPAQRCRAPGPGH